MQNTCNQKQQNNNDISAGISNNFYSLEIKWVVEKQKIVAT